MVVVGREPHAVLEGEPIEGLALRRHRLGVEDAVLGRPPFDNEATEDGEPVLGEGLRLLWQLDRQAGGVASHLHDCLLLLSPRRLVELNLRHLGRRELLQAEVLEPGRVLALSVLELRALPREVGREADRALDHRIVRQLPLLEEKHEQEDRRDRREQVQKLLRPPSMQRLLRHVHDRRGALPLPAP